MDKQSTEIEYAEISWNDGDEGDYLNFYAVDGKTYSYLLEDVFEQMQQLAQLRAVAEAADKVFEIVNDYILSDSALKSQLSDEERKSIKELATALDGAK